MLGSWYDLKNIPEPAYLGTLDNFFTLWYVFDVLANVAVTSFGTFWASNQNKFDTVTTFAILSANIYNASPGYTINREVLRLLNILRILRLVKLLLRLEYFNTVALTIWRMLTTSV